MTLGLHVVRISRNSKGWWDPINNKVGDYVLGNGEDAHAGRACGLKYKFLNHIIVERGNAGFDLVWRARSGAAFGRLHCRLLVCGRL